MQVLLKHELMYYIKNSQQAIYLLSFYITILLLAPFASKLNNNSIQELGIIALWVALTTAISIGAASLFKRDRDEGRLEYYQLLPYGLESIVAAKWLAYLVFNLLPLWLILPVAGMLFDLKGDILIHCAIGLTAGAIALSLITSTVAALASGLEKAGAILSLVILPLSIPVLIFGAGYCRDMSALLQPNLIFLLGFSAVMLPIMCLSGAYAIRASN